MDKELIARFYNGDESAFVELYETYWKKLHPFFFHSTGDYYEAEDLTQETLIKIRMTTKNLKRRYSPEAGATFYTWARRIALNVLIDFWRRQGRVLTFTEHNGAENDAEEQFPFEDNVQETPFSYKPLGLEEGVDAEKRLEFVRECLFQLREPERLVLSLLFLEQEEITQTEIAHLLKVSSSTVTGIKQRAIVKMQSCLKAKGLS